MHSGGERAEPLAKASPFYRRVAAVVMASGLSTAIQLLVGVVAARALAPEGRGTLALLITWAGTISHLGVFGSDVVIARRVGEGRSAIPRLHAAVLLHAAVVGLVGALFVAPLSRITNFSSGHGWIWGWFVLVVATGAASVMLQSLLLAIGCFSTFAYLRVLFPLLVLVLYGSLWASGAASVEQFFSAFALSNVFFVAIAGSAINRARDLVAALPFSPAAWRKLRLLGPEARAAGLGSALRIAETNLPIMLLGFLADRSTVGLFVVASVVCSVQQLVSEAYARVAFGTAASGTLPEPAARPLRLVAIQLGAAFLVAPVGWLFLPLVFGEPFAPARVFVPFLATASALAAVAQVHAETLRGAGHASAVVVPRLFAVGLLGFVPLVHPWIGEPVMMMILAQTAGSLVQVVAYARAVGRVRRGEAVVVEPVASAEERVVASGAGDGRKRSF